MYFQRVNYRVSKTLLTTSKIIFSSLYPLCDERSSKLHGSEIEYGGFHWSKSLLCPLTAKDHVQ